MVNITSLIYDPSPGVTPGDGSIIRTDMYNAIADLLNGISTENYNLVQKISKKTTTYAIGLSDFAIICDATSAGFTVTLPDATAAGISRKMYAIKKTDSTANVVTVATTSSQTIDGSVGTTITQQNEVIFLQSDGTNWQLLGRSLKSILPLANIFTADQTIREDGSAAQLFLEAYGTGNYGHYISKAARGTLASPTASLANDILESIEARGYGATGFSAAGIAQIRFLAAENLTDAHYGSYISFFTTKNTTTTLSEVLRLNNDGTLAIWNPAFTQKYTITPAAITADRVLNVPLLTADDTLAVLGLAQTFTKGQTISPVTINALTLNFPTAPTGSSSVFYGAIKTSQSTIAFATTAQTNDYYTTYFDSAVLTNPSSGTIPNAATLKIVGAPIASTNVTITNNYALWVAGGTSKFDGAVTMTADSSIATTKKFGFNAGLTNYIYESAANVMSHVTNSTESFRIGSTGGIGIISGQKFNLDGVSLAGDTYILESSANVFDLFVGGTNTLRSTASLVNAKVDMTVAGILTVSDYLVTTKNAAGPILPPVADDTGGFAAAWNYSGGGAEVDFFNLFSTNTVTDSYRWYQMLTNGTVSSLLMTLGPNGYLTTYGKIATAGTGVVPVYGSTKQKSETGADTNVLTYTPPAVAGTYLVKIAISVSAASAATLGVTITWKDSNGHAQAPTNIALTKVGTAAPALTFSAAANDVYECDCPIEIDNSATNIVVKTTFSGTSIAYKISAAVLQLA